MGQRGTVHMRSGNVLQSELASGRQGGFVTASKHQQQRVYFTTSLRSGERVYACCNK